MTQELDAVGRALVEAAGKRYGGGISENDLRSAMESAGGQNLDAAAESLVAAGLLRFAPLGAFRYWEATKAGIAVWQEMERQAEAEQAAREARKVEIMKWKARTKTFVRVRVDPEELEAWRASPGRILWTEDARWSHDTSGLDYDRPVRSTVHTKAIGAAVEQGVVADKRIVGGKAEYLLRPHTKATRRKWEADQLARRAAEMEKALNNALALDLNISTEEAAAKRAEIAELRARARELTGA